MELKHEEAGGNQIYSEPPASIYVSNYLENFLSWLRRSDSSMGL